MLQQCSGAVGAASGELAGTVGTLCRCCGLSCQIYHNMPVAGLALQVGSVCMFCAVWGHSGCKGWGRTEPPSRVVGAILLMLLSLLHVAGTLLPSLHCISCRACYKSPCCCAQAASRLLLDWSGAVQLVAVTWTGQHSSYYPFKPWTGQHCGAGTASFKQQVTVQHSNEMAGHCSLTAAHLAKGGLHFLLLVWVHSLLHCCAAHLNCCIVQGRGSSCNAFHLSTQGTIDQAWHQQLMSHVWKMI
ncbi:hypothetical protein COO60DRAFT_1008300 [Scenedesmus sp. NREL 46B-D3]|nr:hypothetical protein COO60DRAFT_1008300 [Scenedesmus sp. NREL 46B-D3]